LTASHYSETSAKIKVVYLNSEQATKTSIESKLHTGNARPDLTITYEINNEFIQVDRDIKSGNNMNNVIRGVLGEVPYKENGQLYQVLNESLSLKNINNSRILFLEKQCSITGNDPMMSNLEIHITAIQQLEPYINNDIFNSKKHFNIFMTKAVIVYHNTVAPILNNVQSTKGALWEVSFLDEISTAVFK
jgi:hypothetical protein